MPAERVDLALVLAADISGSVDEDEVRLQRQGQATALTSPTVLEAIKTAPHHAIAVTFAPTCRRCPDTGMGVHSLASCPATASPEIARAEPVPAPIN